jgi:hypothetical protein
LKTVAIELMFFNTAGAANPSKYGRAMAVLLLLFPAFLGAFDFGLAAAQEFNAQGNDVVFDYTAALIPYFTTPLGGAGDLYISGKASAVYENEKFIFIPELLRTELSWRFDNLGIRIGRIPYADPLNFIIEGFFDGAQVLFDTPIGSFNAGAWYTGLLYKKSAGILMTEEDYASYNIPADYDDFFNTYFASRRLLMAAGWEHPSLAGLVRLRMALTGQFDLNEADTPYNSAYLSLKTVMPLKRFVFNAGFCVCMEMEKEGLGLAGEAGASWTLPTSFASHLSLDWRFGNGKFIPVTAKDQGEVLQETLTGISALSLDYAAMLSQTVAIGLTASLFNIFDANRVSSLPYANDGSYIGSEFFGRFLWSPFTDVNMNLGAGVFIPAASGIELVWRVELGLVIVLY